MRLCFILLGSLLFMLSAGNIAAQNKIIEYSIKSTLVLGKYDTLMSMRVHPDSTCNWTDTSKISLRANIDNFHQIDDSMSAYFVGTPLSAGTWWLYSQASVNLSCGTSSDMADNPDFTVIDPLSVADARIVNVQLQSDRFLSLRSCLPESSPLNVLLYDLLGYSVLNRSVSCPAGTSEIDLGASSLSAGCYWYVVRGDGWSKSGKVMKLP